MAEVKGPKPPKDALPQPAEPVPVPEPRRPGVQVPLEVRLFAGDVVVATSVEHDLWRAVLRVIVEGGDLLAADEQPPPDEGLEDVSQ